MSTTTTNFGLIKLEKTDPADITKINENWDKIDTELKLMLSPKMLGDIDNMDELTDPGHYKGSFNENGVYKKVSVEVKYYSFAGGSVYLCQTLTELSTGVVRKRVKNAGNWSEWEYENPPMRLGTEYRTTERYNDEVVYASLQTDGIIHKRTESGINITPITYGTTEDSFPADGRFRPNGCLHFIVEV